MQTLSSNFSQVKEKSNLADIQQILAEVTRYPLEILEPSANFEEDLGIDSVKFGEIYSVLSDRYKLPAISELNIPPERLQTVADLAGFVAELTTTTTPQLDSVSKLEAKTPRPITTSVNGSSNQISGKNNNIASRQSNLADIQQILAEVTRYPLEILEPSANFEEDLGIDSVKFGEIYSVLSDRYKLPAISELNIPPERLQTVGDLAGFVAELTTITTTPQSDSVSKLEAKTPRLITTSVNGSSNQMSGNQAINNDRYRSKTSTNNATQSSQSLAGKVALITGSGRGLGKVIASYLAQQGAFVITNSFHSRNLGEATAAEIRETGGKAMHIWGSVANPTHVSNLFEQIESEFGKLDFFISNASNGLLASLEDIQVEHLEKAFQTNVIGLHQCAMHASKLMQKQGGGKIITLSAIASQRYVPYFGCMATVKAGVEALTRYLAVELAKYNIQVNCVSSGPLYGELINKWPDSENIIAYWKSRSLGDQLCHPEDVADLVSYLLTDKVKRINGSILFVDAGKTIYL